MTLIGVHSEPFDDPPLSILSTWMSTCPIPSTASSYQAAQETAETQADDLAHAMAAVGRDAAGRIHVGVNLYHFTGGPCAEFVAIAAARASGARLLTKA